MKILLYKGISLFSRGIRIQTRSDYSHAAVELANGKVVEALFWDGVVLADSFETNHTSGTLVDVFVVDDIRFDTIAATKFALSTVGMPYDQMSIMRFLTHTPARVNNKYFCSENVIEVCAAGGQRLQRGDSAQMPPRDVYRSMRLRPIETRVVK